jgi:hypothetical protein
LSGSSEAIWQLNPVILSEVILGKYLLDLTFSVRCGCIRHFSAENRIYVVLRDFLEFSAGAFNEARFDPGVLQKIDPFLVDRSALGL